jgi:DNA (cytosine-5)-methyltransferase 1
VTHYNELDPYAAEWLRNLAAAGHIPSGAVDERSIADVRPEDLVGHEQCHFFAGVGGWAYALRLAGWPADRPVWTGSCPCQPFSVAGRGGGFGDARHLWPEWLRIIRECRPPTIFGEQVASPAGLEWLDAVSADLEGEGYAVGAADLCAAGIGAPHIRQRLFFVAIADGGARPRAGDGQTTRCGGSGPVGDASGEGGGRDSRAVPCEEAGCCCGREEPRSIADEPITPGWADPEWLPCADGKARPTLAGLLPLAHGLPRGLGRLRPWERRLADVAGADVASLRRAGRNRRGRLKGYGNAIVPQVAAVFVRAAREELGV